MFSWKDQKNNNLIKAFLALRNEVETQNFLRDLMTENEIIEFANRYQAAQMLDQKFPYSQIEKTTGLSSATVARVSKWLSSGTGGYRLILDRLGKTAGSEKKRQTSLPKHHSDSSSSAKES